MRLIALLTLLAATGHAQWTIQNAPTTASLRGIHSLGNGIAWASGTEGTVLHTEDGGAHWLKCATPPDAAKLDFRGIQAFDAETAIVMSSGKGTLSRLYKTTDGCATWKLVFSNPDADGFWDAMQFEPKPSYEQGRRGWLLGDPVDHQYALFATFDGGVHWSRLRKAGLLESPNAGGAFAASNSILIANVAPVFVTAHGWAYSGDSSCTSGLVWEHPQTCLPLLEFNKQRLPVAQEGESSGAFSIAKWNNYVTVGGDYKRPDEVEGIAAFSGADFFHWEQAQTPPHGYRSAVAYDVDHKAWITVGPNGTDASTDDGKNWRALKPAKDDAPDADRNWNALSLPFVVGPKGRIGKLNDSALKP